MATMYHDHAAIRPDIPRIGEEPIDFTHLFRMTLGDHSLEREVLALFDRQVDMLIARMGEVDPSCVAALAHTIKGSARGVGAWPVARAAEAVEAASPAGLEPAVAVLAAAAGEARAAIAELLGTA
jgi:HPt (histidine-containing phosphotransfer) domain-containing protein